jgi:type IV pilus assembly protein PilB
MSRPNDHHQPILSPFANQLIQSGYLSLPQLQRALGEKNNSHLPLTEIVEQMTKRPLPPQLLRQYYQGELFKLKILHGVESFDPEVDSISWPAVEMCLSSVLPLEVCQRLQVLPLRISQNAPLRLQVAMVDPSNPQTVETLRTLLQSKNLELERRVIALQDFEQLIEQFIQQQQITFVKDPSLLEPPQVTVVDITDIIEEDPIENVVDHNNPPDPIIVLVNKLLAKALESKASELHIEPQTNSLQVRFRIDGIMRQIYRPFPRNIAKPLVARLKIMADLQVTSTHKPQQGRFHRLFAGHRFDFWIHTLPSHGGEKVFVRIIDSESPCPSLADLIPHEPTRQNIQKLLQRTAGLVLLTAPKGAGGSTTWYSLISDRATEFLNISTIEDPIERLIPHVTQVEINESRQISYPTILNSFLNQDVDIIAVDRIGDLEVGKTLIEMALTGHLVLTTLPLNNPITGILRLNKMGVNRALLAEALLGIINQRLLRRLCPVCRLNYTPSVEELHKFGLPASHRQPVTFYKAHSLSPALIEVAQAKGQLCRHCNGLGYHGQVGIYEVLNITTHLKTQISQDAEAQVLQDTALKDGWETLLSYALDLVYQGHTTLEEVERILPDYLPANLSKIPVAVVSPQAQKQLEELEKLLTTLTEKFQQLKQEIAAVAADDSHPPELELPDSENWEDQFMKSMLIPDNLMYEELKDPGDWEQLKKEFAATQDIIISELEEIVESVPDWDINSMPDPWNQ